MTYGKQYIRIWARMHRMTIQIDKLNPFTWILLDAAYSLVKILLHQIHAIECVYIS